MVNYAENNYLGQYKDLKLFYKEYLGDQLLSPIITYDKMKTYYPIQIIDLRYLGRNNRSYISKEN